MKNATFISDGAFQLSRKLFEHELWTNKPAQWLKIWLYIIGSVQHTDYKQLQRGQGFFNFREIVRMRYLGNDITYSTIDHFLRYAKSAKMIATTKATHGVIILVCNYNLYQNLDNYRSDTQSEDLGEVKAKQKRNRSDNINNNVKQWNNVNNGITNVATPVASKAIEISSKDKINPLIGMFSKVNPSFKLLYTNKTERAALERMVKEHGMDKIQKLVLYLPEIYGKQYAPVVTTPLQLERKMGAVIAFMSKTHTTNVPKIAVMPKEL